LKESQETQLNLPKEISYIISRARAGKHTIVVFGCLVFLSYENGDAYVLDVEDKYACPLCLEGETQPDRISSVGEQWAVQWPWRYFLAEGHICFDLIDADAGDLPWLEAELIEEQIRRYNRKSGTKWRL
jgi:hypothetical protein